MRPSCSPIPLVSIDSSGTIHQVLVMSLPEPTRLTLGQLRTFLAVASTGSVRAAAEQLVVTQPEVSSALAAVRKQVGVALVARDGRGLRLTPAGEALAARAGAAPHDRGSGGGRRGPAARAVGELQLATATWLLREPGSGTRATAEALLDGLGLSPRILTLGSNGAVVESVRIGLGVTLISADAVAGDLTAGGLEEWQHPGLPIERPWHLLGRAGEPLAPTPERFLDHLLDSGWERPEPGAARR